MKTYNAKDWYWIVASDESQVYSSARAAYVDEDDEEFASWQADGARPTKIDSEDSLKAVFAEQYPAGWPGCVRVISSLQFLNRFTAEERTDIRAAAKLSDALEDYLDMQRAAQVVDLDDPVTIAGLASLVAAGLITDQRKTAILG